MSLPKDKSNRTDTFAEYEDLTIAVGSGTAVGTHSISLLVEVSTRFYMMVKPGSTEESTRFYPHFKDCIGTINGTHIPAMVTGRDTSSYRNHHRTILQNALAACNFDLEFICA